MIALSLPWPPSSNNYWTVARNRIINTPTARHYKFTIQHYCYAAGVKPLSGPLKAEVLFYPPDRRKRDGHNLIKILFDALEGLCFEDDSQIEEVYLRIYPKEVVTNGRCLINISHLTTPDVQESNDA